MRRLGVILVLCLHFAAHAQETVALSGYFEPQLMGAMINHGFIQLQSNKLRVDLEGRVTDQVTFGANFNAVTYHGQTQWPVLDLLPERVREEAVSMTVLGLAVDPYVLPFENRIYLDNAYIKIALARVDLTIGRQQLSFGTGYAWNPTDIFNAKDMMDPAYEQPGHNGIRLDWPLSNSMTVTAVYAPEARWKQSTKLLQLKATVGRFDLAVIGTESAWRPHDYTRLSMNPFLPGFVQLEDRRRMAGINLAGELLGLGVWAEGAHQQMTLAKSYNDWLFGMDYTFDGGQYVMAEYFYSGQGHSDKHRYKLNDWMRFLAAEQKTMAREQLYVMAQFPVGDLMTAGIAALAVLSDGSAALMPSLNWSVLENAELTVYGNLYLGSDLALYNPNLGNGGLMRLRVYF